MSRIKDINLKEEGIKKINWARAHMPVLSKIEEDFEKEKPFKGMKIAVSVHLEAKTANLGLVLKKGGAQVFLTGCNPLSTQDDVAAAIASMGVETFGIYGVSMEEYRELLADTLSCHPHLIVDDGGDLLNLLSGQYGYLADRLYGGCEETTTGIHRLYSRERDNSLICPMMAVNDAKAKHYYDNKYGTGQSVLTAIMNTTNLIIGGKTVVVAGYGWCGKGVALRAKGMGARVIVTEIDPFKALDATMNGFSVMTMEEASKVGDIFITVTGCKDVVVRKHFENMKDGAVLCNAGHFDCEINIKELRDMAVKTEERRKDIVGYTLENGKTLNVCGEGRLVNLACGMGHPVEIMDMSFAVQALSLKYLTEHHEGLEKRVINVPEEIDREIGFYKLKTLGLSIDELSPEQEKYLKGWEA